MSLIASTKDKFSFRHKKITIWDRTIRWLLLVVVFLLPIFFLTPNSYPLEFNKVILFDILVLIATVIFLLKALKQREITIVRTFTDGFLLAFVVFYLISFIFSKNHYLSLVGVSGYYSASLVSVICFILFFYLLINVVKEKKDVLWFIGALLIASALVIIYNLFQVNGIYLLPWEITKNASFNLVASSSVTLAIFTAICLFIGFGLFVYLKKKWLVILCGLFVLLSLLFSFLLNKDIAFYILALGLFIFLLLITLKSKQLSNWWVVLPTVVLTVVVLFIFIDSGELASVKIGESIFLDQKTSMTIAWKSFTKTPLWGSGPQTFTYDYNLWRPVEFNDSSLWNLRFIKASNEWFGLLATVGMGGMLTLLVIGLWFLIRGASVMFNTKRPTDDWQLSVILLVAWFMVFLASFFVPFNFILYLLWWLLLALGLKMILLHKTIEKTYSFRKSSPGLLVFIGGFALTVVAAVLVIFFGLKLWLADYNFVKAQRGIAQKQEISTVEGYLQKAIQYNPYETKYYLSLAQGYTTQAQLEALKSETDLTTIQQLTQKVINTLREVEKVDSDNPVIYEQEAVLYDSLRNLISNVDELSVKAYLKLVEVEPINPLAWVNLGRSKLLQAQGMLAVAQDDQTKAQAYQLVDQAIVDFNHASELKKDFVLADTSLAQAYETKNDFDKAVEQLESLLLDYPSSADIHWQLALIYEKQGKIDQAIAELETVQQLNPDNRQVTDKINQLISQENTEDEDSEE